MISASDFQRAGGRLRRESLSMAQLARSLEHVGRELAKERGTDERPARADERERKEALT